MPNLLIYWIIGSFAAYRLGLAITEEEGPASIFQRFRNLFLEDDWIGRGVRCFKCVSFWSALPMAMTITTDLGLYSSFLLIWFGMAGGALVLDKYWKR